MKIYYMGWHYAWGLIRFVFWHLKRIITGIVLFVLIWDAIDLVGSPELKEIQKKIAYACPVLFKGYYPTEEELAERRLAIRQVLCRHITGSNYCPLCGKKLVS